MLALQAGDSTVFEVLIKRWEKRMLTYCYRLVDDRALAEDLRQEVFLRIYRSVETYRPTAQFSIWIYQIAKNLCLDTLAKKGYQAEIPMGDHLRSAFDGSPIDSATPEAILNQQ